MDLVANSMGKDQVPVADVDEPLAGRVETKGEYVVGAMATADGLAIGEETR